MYLLLLVGVRLTVQVVVVHETPLIESGRHNRRVNGQGAKIDTQSKCTPTAIETGAGRRGTFRSAAATMTIAEAQSL